MRPFEYAINSAAEALREANRLVWSSTYRELKDAKVYLDTAEAYLDDAEKHARSADSKFRLDLVAGYRQTLMELKRYWKSSSDSFDVDAMIRKMNYLDAKRKYGLL